MRLQILTFLFFNLIVIQSIAQETAALNEQFIFGFEPTRTNVWILKDSAVSTLKKLLFNKGKSVLEIEGKNNKEVREKFLADVRENCSKCKIIAMKESHGTISYRIVYPDGFYFNMSLDVGTLEWQTKPSTVSEIKSRVDFLQKEIYERAKKVGANIALKATGGHVTFSGFANDSFLFLNYLKWRAHNDVFDWGFFGKDEYNANPVSRWD